MCHANLLIEFDVANKNCFYIGGPNGSGKSALFAAMNMGLGGRGSDSERGNNVQAYIKDGTTQAKITITLTNEGLNALPEYDELISIERTINRTASKYTIRNIKVNTHKYKMERVVSTKKSDVDSVVTRLNIHLTNPAFWMSQDRSRSFLANFKPSTVYKLYLESTNLENIRQSYNRFAESIDHSAELVTAKSEEIANEKRKLKRAQESRVLQLKLEKDRNLLASYRWKFLFCRVRDYDNNIMLNKKKQEVHKKLHKEVKDAYYKNRTERSEVQKKLQELRDEVEVQDEEIKESRADVDNLRKIVNDLKHEIKMSESQMRRKKVEIMLIRKEIAKAQKQLREALGKFGHEELTKKLAEAEDKRESLNIEIEEIEHVQLKALRKKYEKLTKELRNEEEEKFNTRGKIATLRRTIEQDQKILRSMKATKKNDVNKFGPYMSEILTEIDHRSSQFKQKPKGPLGKYVTLVEPKWACATEECFKNIANNFLCCSQEDAATLRKIFDILKIPSNDRPTIVVSRFTGIKYEDLQQPGYQFKTLYRTLAFSDVDVHNAIIDKSNCEQFLLIEDKTAAMKLMGCDDPPKYAVKAYTPDASQIFANGLHSQYRFYSSRGKRAVGLFGVNQKQVDEETLEQELEAANRELIRLENHDIKLIEKTLRELTMERSTIKSTIDKLDKKTRELQYERVKIDRNINDWKADMTQCANTEQVDNINDALGELQEKLSILEEEAYCIQDKLDELDEKFQPAIKTKNESEKNYVELQQEVKGYAAQTLSFQKQLRKLDEDGEAGKNRLDKLKSNEDELYHDEARLKSERDEALNIVEKEKVTIERPRREADPPDLSEFPSTKDARKKIIEMHKAISRDAAECGDTVTIGSVKEFKENLKKLRESCRMLEEVVEEMQTVHNGRLKAYPTLKKYTELKVTDKFKELLAIRGHFVGGLEFDHEKENLNVNVHSTKEKDALAGKEYSSTDEDEDDEQEFYKNGKPKKKRSKKTKKKPVCDLKGLSGGERSFVTAALVMSLWEVMEQPFRMLDEFDVFMDMMNRKLVMDLLVEMATKKFPHNQFIFFTPQGIKELNRVDGLQIFEMEKVRD
ncbi:AAA_23 domain-containing protein [Caenorhabditis elegans]|nr:AAA_23 domain-containing protein [Caenorhabditis elegans]CAR97808.1 AAA_23 domain-containing protein [Caenorhabditis elegans]|eukprot:NP_001257190.1 Structural maintenance of chromosomes protein 6 [Caenorhabditis elegans]